MSPKIKLSDAQWDLLLRTARANEAHDEPPRLRRTMRVTMTCLVRMGLLEPGGRRCTEAGWFYVRDHISDRAPNQSQLAVAKRIRRSPSLRKQWWAVLKHMAADEGVGRAWCCACGSCLTAIRTGRFPERTPA